MNGLLNPSFYIITILRKSKGLKNLVSKQVFEHFKALMLGYKSGPQPHYLIELCIKIKMKVAKVEK